MWGRRGDTEDVKKKSEPSGFAFYTLSSEATQGHTGGVKTQGAG